VLIGRQAGFKLTTGKWNVFIGKQSGNVVTTGQQNTIIGNGANVVGNAAQNRTAIGAGAVNSNNNTVVLGNNNVTEVWMAQDKGATVYAAGYVGDLTGNVTGDITGGVTGNVTGNVTGDLTGNADTASALSTAIGINDLSDASSSGTTTSDNLIFGGAYTAQTLAGYSYANTNLIGYGAGIGGYYDNQMVLGNSSVTRIYGSSDWGANYYGNGYYTASDRRFKTNIINLDSQIESLSKIKSKSYTNLNNGNTEIGVIAQEVFKVFPELVEELDYVTDNSLEKGSNGEKRFAVNYQGFVPILINVVNEQQVMIKELQEKVDEIEVLKQEIQMIKDMMNN